MLWLDIGNSRMKWLYGTAADEHGGALAYRQPDDLQSAPIWQAIPKGTPVWASSVANPSVRQAVETAAKQIADANVHWARSEQERNGLRNSYQDISRLGVDRWMVMLAAWQQEQSAFVVVDAGSAITVDYVDGNGQHLGGHIVPGLNLMTRALFSGTANVKFNALDWGEIGPGKSTEQCVHHGVFAMATGYLEYLLTQWHGASAARWLITGGDALRLQSALSIEAEWRPNLVIEGLQIFAEER